LPAKLIVDDRTSPVARNLPETFVSPTNEWYRWKPSPRADSHIHVLLTLDPSNYPLGIKGLLTYGDIPVVWTNTQYKMVYMNMGHGDKVFTSSVQNTLIENATEWLLGRTEIPHLAKNERDTRISCTQLQPVPRVRLSLRKAA
jgi:type 1 glutamine amidotransferase